MYIISLGRVPVVTYERLCRIERENLFRNEIKEVQGLHKWNRKK